MKGHIFTASQNMSQQKRLSYTYSIKEKLSEILIDNINIFLMCHVGATEN